MRVLMIGDNITDEYRYVTALGKPPKEHIVATLFKESETFGGGVLAAAKHVEALCDNVTVITSPDSTRKVRYVDPEYMRKLFEVYHAPKEIDTEQIEKRVRHHIDDAQCVIVTDFGHGMISHSLISLLCEDARFLAVNAQTNSGNFGFNLITKYRGANCVCLDGREARLAIQDIDASAREATLRLRRSHEIVVVTEGKDGSTGADPYDVENAPAFTQSVVDTIGAGDAFFAVTAPLAAAGASMEDILFIGNCAGAIKTQIVGHRQPVTKAALVDMIRRLTA